MTIINLRERFLEAKKRLKEFEASYQGSRNTGSYFKRKGAFLSAIKSASEHLKKYASGTFYQVDVVVSENGKKLVWRVFYITDNGSDIEYLIKRDFPSHLEWKSREIKAGQKLLIKSSK